jgi:phosphoserine phosphatase
VIRLRKWLELQNTKYKNEETTFYSDSFNDLPLLETVGTAVAVDPDDRLRDVAGQRGWKLISLRGDAA